MTVTSLLYSHLGSHFAGGQCHVLPPIAQSPVGSARYAPPTASTEAQKNSHLQRHARQLSAQNSTLKQAVRRHLSLAEAAEEQARCLREELSRANDELARARAEVRTLKLAHGDEVSQLQHQLAELRSNNLALHAKLDMAGLAKRKVELENKRTVEAIVSRHDKESSTRTARHKQEIAELKEQLEMVVLKAAIDLNKQYRELYISNFKQTKKNAVRPRRRTDGDAPVPLLMEVHKLCRDRNAEETMPPGVRSSREINTDCWDLKDKAPTYLQGSITCRRGKLGEREADQAKQRFNVHKAQGLKAARAVCW
eukprot:jgi/Tetstr1/426240/TSEL_016560.t1